MRPASHPLCRLLPAILLFVLHALPTVAAEPPSHSFTLTILHTNDVHGHLVPFAYTERGRSPQERPSAGGAARRATLIRRLRAEIQNPSILVDAGDVFTRGPLTNAYEGIADVEAMNAAGYDLAAIGNNEFKARDGVDAGDAAGAESALLGVVKRSRFPWICANVRDERGGCLEGVQPYVVRTFRGLRFGFLGLTAPRSASYPQTKGWSFTDPIAAGREWAPRARAHCDVLIAVTHIGYDADRQLAAQVAGIDAIVGGDSHTFLYHGDSAAGPDGRRTPIVQDGEFGVNVGRCDLKVVRQASGRWRVASFREELLPVGTGLRDDPAVAAALSPYLRPFRVVVGRLARIAPTPAGRSRQTTQVFVDAMRAATGAEVALSPDGAGLFEHFHHPSVTRLDVYAAEPFHNNIVLADLTGPRIAALLKARPSTVFAGDIPHLRADRTYRVAFMDFVASSEYGLDGSAMRETGQDVRVAVTRYLIGTRKRVNSHPASARRRQRRPDLPEGYLRR